MLATIKSSGEGRCVWCCADGKEGLEVEFNDGLKGFLCWADFRAAVKARNGQTKEKETTHAPKQ